MSVPEVTLEETCDFLSGFAWSATKFNTSSLGIPIIRIQNVDSSRDKDFIYWDEPYEERFVIEKDDLLLTLSGSFRVGLWDGPSALLNQRIVKLIPKKNVTPEWLLHILRHRIAKISNLGRHALVSNVALADLRKFSVPLPSLPEQRRIAAILDQADALRAKRREALAQLDSLTQSIFIEMFGDPAINTSTPNFQPLESLLEESFQNGAYFPKETYCESGGAEMVHMSDAFGGCVKRGHLKRVNCSDADIKKYALTTSDILIARRSLTYEGAAKPCMIPQASEPLIFESSFIRVRPDRTKITPLYLFYYLNNDRVKKTHIRPYVTQSTISGINQSNLAQVPVMQPPLELQKEFGLKVQSIENLRLTQVTSLSELDTLFASIQHRAFQGEL